MLNIFELLPEGFLGTPASGLHRILSGPTLIHLPGRRPNPLFVSALLHGNEDTGLKALQQVLIRYRALALPRALSIFIGNVEAAAQNLRRLDRQPDYNRVWPGPKIDTAIDAGPEQMMMREVVDQMRRRQVFASLDIHNNTGLNPYYACVNVLAPEFLHLATLFSRTLVYFRRPLGVQSLAFAELCPAVTVECGKPGTAANEQRAAEFIEAALHLDHFPQQLPATRDFDLYHTVATIKVPPDVSFRFGAGAADICFEPTLDHLNFRDLPAGTRLATLATPRSEPLEAWAEDGHPVTARYLERTPTELRLRRAATPAMLTLDARAIRQDCLCYLMERVALRGAPATASA